MENDILLTKIESLRRCVSRLEEKRPLSPEVLSGDIDLQDIISVNLERAVQSSVDIASHILAGTNNPLPSTMAESFTSLREIGVIDEELAERMRKAVGFRNIAVHEYEKIDWDIVFSIITNHLDDFKRYAGAVLKSVEDGGP